MRKQEQEKAEKKELAGCRKHSKYRSIFFEADLKESPYYGKGEDVARSGELKDPAGGTNQKELQHRVTTRLRRPKLSSEASGSKDDLKSRLRDPQRVHAQTSLVYLSPG